MSDSEGEFFRERFHESGFTEHERIVYIDGRRVVMPVGTPVTRGTVRWGRRPEAKPDGEGHPESE